MRTLLLPAVCTTLAGCVTVIELEPDDDAGGGYASLSDGGAGGGGAGTGGGGGVVEGPRTILIDGSSTEGLQPEAWVFASLPGGELAWSERASALPLERDIDDGWLVSVYWGAPYEFTLESYRVTPGVERVVFDLAMAPHVPSPCADIEPMRVELDLPQLPEGSRYNVRAVDSATGAPIAAHLERAGETPTAVVVPCEAPDVVTLVVVDLGATARAMGTIDMTFEAGGVAQRKITLEPASHAQFQVQVAHASTPFSGSSIWQAGRWTYPDSSILENDDLLSSSAPSFNWIFSPFQHPVGRIHTWLHDDGEGCVSSNWYDVHATPPPAFSFDATRLATAWADESTWFFVDDGELGDVLDIYTFAHPGFRWLLSEDPSRPAIASRIPDLPDGVSSRPWSEREVSDVTILDHAGRYGYADVLNRPVHWDADGFNRSARRRSCAD